MKNQIKNQVIVVIALITAASLNFACGKLASSSQPSTAQGQTFPADLKYSQPEALK